MEYPIGKLILLEIVESYKNNYKEEMHNKIYNDFIQAYTASKIQIQKNIDVESLLNLVKSIDDVEEFNSSLVHAETLFDLKNEKIKIETKEYIEQQEKDVSSRFKNFDYRGNLKYIIEKNRNGDNYYDKKYNKRYMLEV